MKGLIFIKTNAFSTLESIYLELSLDINRMLYSKNIITYQIFKQIEDKLLKS